MADARIIEVCDEVAAFLTANWSGKRPTITRDYLVEFDKKDFTGPTVYVMGASYAQAEVADRSGDINSYTVSVVFAEKYTGDDKPTKAWVDARIELVRLNIYGPLGDHRNLVLDDLWPETSEVPTVYDYDFLNMGLFVSECVFEFRQVED